MGCLFLLYVIFVSLKQYMYGIVPVIATIYMVAFEIYIKYNHKAMCKFIGMEYFAAIAMVSLKMEEIPLKMLNGYGISVMKSFKENDIEAIILYSEKYISKLVRDYSDCFELSNDGKSLRKIVDDDVLIEKFWAYLSTDLILAMMNTFNKQHKVINETI